eukprot:854640-Prymnesium_polylepis.2
MRRAPACPDRATCRRGAGFAGGRRAVTQQNSWKQRPHSRRFIVRPRSGGRGSQFFLQRNSTVRHVPVPVAGPSRVPLGPSRT